MMRRIPSNTRVGVEEIAAVRHFNRFYTRAIGALHDGSLYKPYSLAQARVLYEIGSVDRDGSQAGEIAQRLQLDEAYLSRILSKFEKSGLLTKQISRSDKRHNFLRLTAVGKEVLGDLNARSNHVVSSLLKPLTSDRRVQLLNAMRTVEMLLVNEKKI